MNMFTQQGRKEKRRMHSKSNLTRAVLPPKIIVKHTNRLICITLSFLLFVFQIFRGTMRSLPLRKRWVALQICLQARVATLQVVGKVTRGGLVQHIRRIHAV